MHRRRTVLLSALCGALLGLMTPGVSIAEAAPSTQCAPFSRASTDRVDDQASCLDAAVRLSEAPAVGRRAVVDIEVRTTWQRTPVNLDVRLPAGLEWAKAPSGLRPESRASAVPADGGRVNHARGRAEVGRDRPLRLRGTVRGLAEGAAEIRAVVTAPATGDTRSASVFLTVGAQRSAFGIRERNVNPTAPATGPTDRAYAHLSHKPAEPVKAPASGAATACATGGWGYVDHTGASRVSANAQVQVWDSDATGQPDLLASGLTDGDGTFQLCFDNTDEDGSGQDVYVRFGTENTQWIIRNGRSRKSYRFDSGVTSDVANGATVDIGRLQPGDPALMRGVEAFDTINAGWNWTPGACWDAYDSVCRRGKVNWAPDSTDGTYYSLQENAVHLAAADPDANILVLHEFGHAMMDDLYEDDFPPVTNCSPHYINKTSSEGCAWTEGFATWYGVAVLGDPTFRWPGGRTLDLEGPTWGTPTWDNGDTVEGRVLGSMIDLYDATNEEGDNCAEDPRGPLWTTSLNHVSDTFRQFWAQRGQDGFDVGPTALDCLYHNTIDY